MRRLIVFLAAIAFVLVAALLVVNPVDALLNRTTGKPHPVPAEAQALHDSLWIGDFHNDALLWDRNILEPSSRGLVDLPRLERGGFELAAPCLVRSVSARVGARGEAACGRGCLTETLACDHVAPGHGG